LIFLILWWFFAIFATEICQTKVVMRNIVYINTFQNYEQYDKFHDMINGVDCSKLYREEIVDDSRPVWGKFIDDLQEGDTATFLSFNNAFRNLSEMTMFLKLCSAKNIRIVSIMDSLDSTDELFPESHTKNVFEVISKLPLNGDRTTKEYSRSELKAINARSARIKKHQTVVNMYKGGYNVHEIMERLHIKSKSTIYDILHKYNINLDYPKMIRLKLGKGNPEESNMMRMDSL
jgi:DNA invertase Pin-like site-specific DNA recombinase